MSAPDPESVTLLTKILAAGAAVVAPVYGIVKYLDARFDKKADKEDFAAFLERSEQYRRETREVQIKLFDKIDSLKDTIIERFPK